MRHGLLTIATVATTLYATGCMRSLTSRTLPPDPMAVSVRFVLPNEQEWYSSVATQTETQLAAESSHGGFSKQEGNEEQTTWSTGAYHAALWGGPYNGMDVTTRPTSLPPGSYTFVLFDQPDKTAMQGWLDVRNTRTDLISVLLRWRDSIAEQKERFAYDLEIDGRTRVSDAEVFKSFKEQMKAYDRLERRLENTISAEYQAQKARHEGLCDLLRHAEVVIIPGEDSFFHMTTQPTFSEDDLEAVRAGYGMTKFVLAADHEEARWKLDRLNQVYDDLSGFTEVLKQEADRLGRRKGLLHITDHLYHHDKRFVENEIRLQHTLGLLERFQRQLLDLRERRMALAFITSLFTPDASFSALDEDINDLLRERTVLETERQRLDRLFDETGESSVRRVTLERGRQNAIAMIDGINRQIEDAEQARIALAAMVESTAVIHRYDDMRLLTTTLVADRLSPRIRQIVERGAMMTVRLQATDKVFVPGSTSVARTRSSARPTYASKVLVNDEEQVSRSDIGESASDGTAAFERGEPTDGQRNGTASLDGQQEDMPWYLRLICPPCWFDGLSDNPSQPVDLREPIHSTLETAWPVAREHERGDEQDDGRDSGAG